MYTLFSLLLIGILSVWTSPISAAGLSISDPVFTDTSGEEITPDNLSIQVSVQYDAQNYGTCIQSQESENLRNTEELKIYEQIQKYASSLTGILTANEHKKWLPKCVHDSDASNSTRTYPLEYYINYSSTDIQKNLANTKWRLSAWIGERQKVLDYPTGFFLSRVDSGVIPDTTWDSNGKEQLFNSNTQSYTHFFEFTPSKDGSWGIFYTTGSIIGKDIQSSIRKSWYGAMKLQSERNSNNTETISYKIINPKTNFSIFLYPDGKNISGGLYREGKLVKKLRKNIDFWVKPSKIEAGKFITYKLAKLAKQWDEIRMTVTPVNNN